MGKPVQGPGNGDGAATQDVASILAGLTFPTVEPFTENDHLLSGLPAFMEFPVPHPEPPSRAGVAREVIAAGVQALGVVRGLESSLAACKAALVGRVLGAVAVESAATELTAYQIGLAHTGCVAEIAAALLIPERTAAGLGAHAQDLGSRPATRAALEAGTISWRHVCTVLQELQTLKETPLVTGQQLGCFELELLRLAEGTTASRFAGKVRRARESLFPQSLDARMREAFRSRRITNDPGRDGMNWLTLHLPTIAANAIMVHCTRTARAIKADALQRQREADALGTGEDCREYRTLDQLRADIAAILLMGQQLPADSSAPARTENSMGGSKARTDTHGGRNMNRHSGAGSRTGGGAGADARAGGGAGAGAGAGTGDQPQPQDYPAGQDPAGAPDRPFPTELHDDRPPWERATTAQTAPTQPGQPGQSGQPGPPKTGPPESGQPAPPLPPAQPCPPPSVQPGTTSAGHADVPLEGMLLGDGTGWVDGVVDGIAENPQQEFMDQLNILGEHRVLADPPLPKALVLIQVPFLGLLGLTHEPAQLDDSTAGPVPLAIARKLLASANTFLRVLTDPLTGRCLPLEPDRYKLRDAERSVLQALSGGCYFPNCGNPVLDTELDHVRSFELGGKSTMANLRPACLRHHHLKHFRDDKDRHGNPRRWSEPWRSGIRLRGWAPRPQADGTLAWDSPSGNSYPTQDVPAHRPAYPAWLKLQIKGARSRRHHPRPTLKPRSVDALALGTQFLRNGQ